VLNDADDQEGPESGKDVSGGAAAAEAENRCMLLRFQSLL
jgi:hypothetical protein